MDPNGPTAGGRPYQRHSKGPLDYIWSTCAPVAGQFRLAGRPDHASPPLHGLLTSAPARGPATNQCRRPEVTPRQIGAYVSKHLAYAAGALNALSGGPSSI